MVGVGHEVDDDLMQLMSVGPDVGEGVRQVQRQHNIVQAQVVGQQLHRVPYDVVEVDLAANPYCCVVSTICRTWVSLVISS